MFASIKDLRSDNFDYIPTDLSDCVAPLLVEHFERVNTHPKIVEYYANR